ncbi:hypothetical protein LU196_07150 [Pantoea sp. Mb-10]|uniref:hypothetical protein n=1 Tax=unclassified Pantoea TaxID=2630326 RepID=UPI001E554A9C|nr:MULTISPECIES: hypothetical protein [unclassified Pantoea]MCE0489828.1 hypothetical protein [Pantoea sp. Mb-10]MCE0501067.1 hypothetical protein [Pantoea sp. Pb-8]
MKRDEFTSRTYPVKEDMRWQKKESTLQRLGQYLLIMVVIMGAAGLFSKGWLSDRIITAKEDAFSVKYERFGRVKSNMAMVINTAVVKHPRFSVTLTSDALDEMQIQTLQPQPLEAWSTGNQLTLLFSSHDVAGHAIWLGVQPQSAGKITLRVSLDALQPVVISQWIYP